MNTWARLGAALTAGCVLAVTAGALVPAVASASSAQASRTDWAHDFEDSLGAPQGGNNDAVLIGWMLAEGGGTFTSPAYNNVSKYNPLNTTLNEPGSYSINNLGGGHGVQAYSSWALGIKANHDAIAVGSYGYPAIVADLRANAPVATTAAAIGASSWCSPNACYGGAGAPRIVALSGGVPSGSALAAPSGSATYAQCSVGEYHAGSAASTSSSGWVRMWNVSCNESGAASGYIFTYTSHNSPGGTTSNSTTWGTAWYGGCCAGASEKGSKKSQASNGGLYEATAACISAGNCSGLDYGFVLTNLQIIDGSGTHATTFAVSTLPDQNQTTAATWPAYPLNYYSGGVAGAGTLPVPPTPATTSTGGGVVSNGVTLPAAGTPLCSRAMPSAVTAPVNFVGTIARTSGVGYSYQWAFGDGVSDTAGPTVFNDSHLYTVTQPAGGWIAVLTVTATGDGVTYSGSTTSTCSLRVDFANPADDQPGGPNSAGSDSNSCPSGWGWLNPSALVKIAQCLFVPSAATGTAITGLWSTIQTTEPFSFVINVATWLPHVVGVIQSQQAAGSGLNSGLCLIQQGPNSGYLGTGAAHIHDPVGANSGSFCLKSVAQSSGGGIPGGGTMWDDLIILRAILLVVLLVGAAIGLWHWIAKTIEA